jgi:hypothetical protein
MAHIAIDLPLGMLEAGHQEPGKEFPDLMEVPEENEEEERWQPAKSLDRCS